MSFARASIKRLVRRIVPALGASAVGRFAFRQLLAETLNRRRSIEHNGLTLSFAVPNELNEYRAATFSTKEPETLAWIDSMPEGSVLWDIGANVGLYSCYAAKAKQCRVWAFEPSPFNLDLLGRNVFFNGLWDLVTIIPLPLAESLGRNTLNMTNMDWGGAMSTFGESYGHDGRMVESIFRWPTVGLSMDDAARKLEIPAPRFIKMDVDGIEHLILRGGSSVLADVESILIEVNDSFEEQAVQVKESLSRAGMALSQKSHSACVAGGGVKHTFNQIWVRPQ